MQIETDITFFSQEKKTIFNQEIHVQRRLCASSDKYICLLDLNRTSCMLQTETDSWIENAANGLMGRQVSL